MLIIVDSYKKNKVVDWQSLRPLIRCQRDLCGFIKIINDHLNFQNVKFYSNHYQKNKYKNHQYVKLERSSCEILRNSLEEAMTDYGYKLVKDAPIVLDIYLRKYLHVIDTASRDYSGKVFSDIQFDVSVIKDGTLVAKKFISEHSEKKFAPFSQRQDAELLLSDCLSKAVERFVSDTSILNEIKRAYGIEIPEEPLEPELARKRIDR